MKYRTPIEDEARFANRFAWTPVTYTYTRVTVWLEWYWARERYEPRSGWLREQAAGSKSELRAAFQEAQERRDAPWFWNATGPPGPRGPRPTKPPPPKPSRS